VGWSRVRGPPIVYGAAHAPGNFAGGLEGITRHFRSPSHCHCVGGLFSLRTSHQWSFFGGGGGGDLVHVRVCRKGAPHFWCAPLFRAMLGLEPHALWANTALA
jgi:hypothetical protein